MATDRVKKIVIWVVFAFIIYSVLSDPHHSAAIVRNIWSVLRTGGVHIGEFLHDVTR